MCPCFAGVRRKRGAPPFPKGGSFLSSGDVTSVVILLLSASCSLLPTEPDLSELERDNDGDEGDDDRDGEIKFVSKDGPSVDDDKGGAKEGEDEDDGNDDNGAAEDCSNDDDGAVVDDDKGGAEEYEDGADANDDDGGGFLSPADVIYECFAGVGWKRGAPPFPVGGSFWSSGDVISGLFLLFSASSSLLPTEPDSSELERGDDECDDDDCKVDECDDDKREDSDKDGASGFSSLNICLLTVSALTERFDGLDR